MELKYKENVLWKVAGFIWLTVALLNVGLILFLINGFTGGFGLLISPILLLTVLLSSALSIFYFKINSIDYIRLKDNVLSIYKGLVLPRQKISILEIEESRLFGNEFILILKNEKEVKINLNHLTIKDHDRLKEKLDGFFFALV